MPIPVREAIKRVEADGWYLVHQKGSHRQYKHAVKSGRVTIAGNQSDELHPKTFKSVLRQAGLEDQ
ncbi:MAG: type II toxin-antitoxin system HicA family toxin [Planctomycetaceae bacterium]|nr:type II toxin-antitoxin system HicA family toxin [Planctomycetaceae bacterium]